MKRTRPITGQLAAIAVVVLGLPLAAGAAPGPGAPCPPPPGPLMGMPPRLNALDLSDTQQDKLFEIIYRQMPAMHRATMRITADRETLNTLAHAASYDEKAARQTAADLGKTEATLALLQNRQQHRIYALLTTAQRKRLQHLQNEHTHCGNPPERFGPPTHRDDGNRGMPPANSCRKDDKNDRMSDVQPPANRGTSRLRT